MAVNYKNEGHALTSQKQNHFFCLHLFWDHGTKLFHFANPSTSFLVWKASISSFLHSFLVFVFRGKVERGEEARSKFFFWSKLPWLGGV